jgi:hypothetical protein
LICRGNWRRGVAITSCDDGVAATKTSALLHNGMLPAKTTFCPAATSFNLVWLPLYEDQTVPAAIAITLVILPRRAFQSPN